MNRLSHLSPGNGSKGKLLRLHGAGESTSFAICTCNNLNQILHIGAHLNRKKSFSEYRNLLSLNQLVFYVT